MTSAILRRNSSKQGLQNLIRLTAQWSVEDEEEAARERRRREREKQLRSQAEEGLNGTVSCSESAALAQENHYDFKPSGTSELEEDEGFSDWSQKLEQRKQRSPRQSYEEEDSGVREAEVKLEQIQLDQECLEEKMVGREEGRLCQEEEEAQEQEEGEQAEQEEKKRRRNDGGKEEETPEKRQKAPSLASLEEEELCSDHTAVCSTKITDRTESLNRSIQKSNSIKRSQPPLPVSKIDDRLEQYTQAIETSTKAPKPVRQPSLDLPTTSMMVASTKSLWETGEVTAQSAVKPSACKVQLLEDLPCLCQRQGLVPGHSMHCPCLSCWYLLFVGPTSSKGISVRGLPSCRKALHLGDAIFLIGSPVFPWWYIQENLCAAG
ncbi:lymphocyte-specific protein 1 isoform X4 [Poecile atricapillus]|uniref:lymphocyte-specific protein 1 isoform X4 n=1 Tax=Poecile atricapillus TaxID=48891 RepID=UPI00273845A3|nr:lymphocyte-specific protein 1 isoform X4 [Poecile atricapillus]